MKKPYLLVAAAAVVILFAGSGLQAQLLPANANANFYFAHLADGGPSTAQWRTVFRIVNPLFNQHAVSGTISFFAPQGNPISLDFGSGLASTLSISIPAGGAVQYQSTGSNATLQTGTAWASFDAPVLAVEEFQNWNNGAVAQAASVNPSGGTYLFQTFADNYTGIAVANVTASPIYCSGSFVATNGIGAGANSFTVPGVGQALFNVGNALSFTSTKAGSYTISCYFEPNAPSDTPPSPFVALAIAGNASGITSSMPPGDFALPRDPYPMIWNAFYQMVKVLNADGLAVGQPQLQVTFGQPLNAFFTPTTNTITIEYGLVQLFADSPSEVAYVIGHELGHAHQFQLGVWPKGPFPLYPSNIELDADAFSQVASLLTGYDPYAIGGALGKLMMATQQTSIVAQNFDNLEAILGIDPHTSFNNRIGTAMANILAVCQIPQEVALCQLEHSLSHNDISIVPLDEKTGRKAGK